MNKSAILSYILVFGVWMSFAPCQCMELPSRVAFSPEELTLTRSSIEDTRIQNPNYTWFYEKINEFSRLADQNSEFALLALSEAKRASQGIRKSR